MPDMTGITSNARVGYDVFFILLFCFKYLRLAVHLFSFWILYRPIELLPKSHRIYTPKQCAVIIPTIDPGNSWFEDCLTSISDNGPGAVIIVTVGRTLRRQTHAILDAYREHYPEIEYRVITSRVANKRRQLAQAIPLVPDLCPIIALVDDQVVWPSTNFLSAAMAPFEDIKVGMVGTNKRVRRLNRGSGLNGFWNGFWNFLSCLYLERHNFENRATNAIDGGVFAVSGRTSLHRTLILQDPDFIRSFTNETVLGFGPLAADDGNHITRWNISHDWDIKIQHCRHTLIETAVGEDSKYLNQCLHWARTTWRSNSCALFTNRAVWCRQPWCVYAVYITSFFNFALVTDTQLLWLVRRLPLVRLIGMPGSTWLSGSWRQSSSSRSLTSYASQRTWSTFLECCCSAGYTR